MTSDATGKTGQFQLSHDAWGQLVMIDAEGRQHVGVEPVRAFPISDTGHWISLCDREGRELVSVRDAADLPAAVRQVLEEDLARREFAPVLKRIYGISTQVEPSEWDVETDRGRTRFMLNSEDDIRRLGPFHGLIIDVNGIRYLIDDVRNFDLGTRRMLERYF